MVGGEVIGLARKEDATLLHVFDKTYGDTCCVRVVERRKDNGSPVTIGLGDQVWWQSGSVYLTPKGVCHVGDVKGCGVRWDIDLPKKGYSHR